MLLSYELYISYDLANWHNEVISKQWQESINILQISLSDDFELFDIKYKDSDAQGEVKSKKVQRIKTVKNYCTLWNGNTGST